MYFRFETSPDHPRFSPLGFRVQPSTFEIELLAALEHAYERRDLAELSQLGEGWTPAVTILEECVARTNEGQIIEISSDEAVALFDTATVMIAESKYRTAQCPECQETFSSTSVEEVDFGFDDDSCRVGGHRYECPRHHVLFAMIRFDRRLLGEPE